MTSSPQSDPFQIVRDAIDKADWDGYWLDDGSQPIEAWRSLALESLQGIEEQLEAAQTIIEAVARGRVGPAHGVLARDLLSNPAMRPSDA